MKIFICGIIQGSHLQACIHSQSYRERLRRILRSYFPQAEIYCPVSLHPNSIEYSDEEARLVFAESVKEATSSDLLIAYLPEASMGSAIEMWEAKKQGVKIVCITPMKLNWIVRITADYIFDTIEDFESFLRQSSQRLAQ